MNIRESSYKNKTLFLDSACRITPQIHSLRDTNSLSRSTKKLSLFFSLFSFLFTEYLSKKGRVLFLRACEQIFGERWDTKQGF